MMTRQTRGAHPHGGRHTPPTVGSHTARRYMLQNEASWNEVEGYLVITLGLMLYTCGGTVFVLP